MKKRFLSVVLACSLTAVSLAGCGGGGNKETQPAAAPTTAAEAGEKETTAIKLYFFLFCTSSLVLSIIFPLSRSSLLQYFSNNAGSKARGIWRSF